MKEMKLIFTEDEINSLMKMIDTPYYERAIILNKRTNSEEELDKTQTELNHIVYKIMKIKEEITNK